MINFFYSKGCRSCEASMGNNVYSLIEGNELKYMSMTEFQVMNTIERWHYEDKKKCTYCNSSYVELFDINVNGNELFNLKKIAATSRLKKQYVFIIEVNKSGTQVNISKDGHAYIPDSDLKLAFREIHNTLDNRDSHSFCEHNEGHFYICLTIDKEPSSVSKPINVEKLRYIGLSKGLLKSILQQLENQ